MTTPATPDVSPFKNDAERDAFWAAHLATQKRLGERAERALDPWREYLAETAKDRQVYRVIKAIRLAIEAADFKAEHPDLPVSVRISRGYGSRREGRRVYVDVVVGEPGQHNHSSLYAHIGVRGAMGGFSWSAQLGVHREF